MNGDERMFPGGLNSTDGDRTDVYLEESGPGKNEAAGDPMTFDVKFVTGNGCFTLTEVKPRDLKHLAEWLLSEANHVLRRDSWITEG